MCNGSYVTIGVDYFDLHGWDPQLIGSIILLFWVVALSFMMMCWLYRNIACGLVCDVLWWAQKHVKYFKWILIRHDNKVEMVLLMNYSKLIS